MTAQNGGWGALHGVRDPYPLAEELRCREGNTLVSAGTLYLIGVTAWVCFIPTPGEIPDGIPHDASGVAYLVLELVSGILLYDFLFFFVHWLLHSTSASVHKRHHCTSELRARDVLEHSAVDGGLQVLVNIIVQRRVGLFLCAKSRVARCLHNVIVTCMLTESHTSAPSPNVFRRWCQGVRRHREHHLKNGPYYQQFFGYLDDAFAHIQLINYSY